jgi:hypothetical protein
MRARRGKPVQGPPVMARPKQATKAPERISPTEALRLLLPEFSPHAAAARLTTAIRANECRLWCNGDVVPVAYIATSLIMVARTEADDRWRADVVSSSREAWERPRDFYVFEFDADEVRALLPRAEASAPDESAASRRRKPGPKVKKDWRLHAAAHVYDVKKKTGRTPPASEIAQYCEDTLDYQPDSSEIQKLLRYLLGD